MFLPSKKLWLPGSKQPCLKNGYAQSAKDARQYRDRFRLNPLAKVAGMFVPKPLRGWRWYPCCCEGGVPCEACESGYGPEQFEVVINGLTNDIVCEECTLIDGSYILDPISISGLCAWQYTLIDYCSTAYLRAYVQIVGGKYRLGVQLNTSTYWYCGWVNNYDTPFDCTSLTDEELLTKVRQYSMCNNSSATCFISAL